MLVICLSVPSVRHFSRYFFQIDKKVITELAQAENITAELASKSLIKHYCTVTKSMPVAFADNMTGECAIRYEEAEVKEKCKCATVNLPDSKTL